MTNEDLLAMLKANLQLVNAVHDAYLLMLIEAAKREIAREGIVLGDTVDDSNLIVMYAAYLYRERAAEESGTPYTTAVLRKSGMPRMLRYALNQRLFTPPEDAGEEGESDNS